MPRWSRWAQLIFSFANLDPTSGIQQEDDKVQQLVGMGFESAQCVKALEACNGNMERALEKLLSGV